MGILAGRLEGKHRIAYHELGCSVLKSGISNCDRYILSRLLMSKRIAIILAGCGVRDGSEIHESVLALLEVVKTGCTALFYAPNIEQKTHINHFNAEIGQGSRNVLEESARIARGEIKPLEELNSSCAEAMIFPGGFGAALNLCDFAQKGASCSVNPEVERVIKEFHAAKKPIGAICISPSVIAKVLGGGGSPTLSIGTDEGTAQELEKLGASHVVRSYDEIAIDELNLIVSTPAYMLANNIAEAHIGITKLVHQVVEMA